MRCRENFAAKGRKRSEQKDPQLAADIRVIVEPHSYSTLAITALSVADCPRDCCHLLRGRARPPEAGPLAAGKYPQVVVERQPARFQASNRARRRRPGSDLNNPIIHKDLDAPKFRRRNVQDAGSASQWPKSRRSEWFGFDVDALVGHSQQHGRELT